MSKLKVKKALGTSYGIGLEVSWKNYKIAIDIKEEILLLKLRKITLQSLILQIEKEHLETLDIKMKADLKWNCKKEIEVLNNKIKLMRLELDKINKL